MCNGSEKDGKYAALQREIARRSVRGELRASSLGLESVSHEIACLFEGPASCDHRCGVCDAKAVCPQCRVAGSCRILYTDF